MAGQGTGPIAGKKTSNDKTPLLGHDDLESAYGTTDVKKPGAAVAAEAKPQTLWEWTKAEVACYSKYMCPVILANVLVLIIVLAYFGVIS